MSQTRVLLEDEFYRISLDSIGFSLGRPDDVPIGLHNMSWVKNMIHSVVFLLSEIGQVMGLYMI